MQPQDTYSKLIAGTVFLFTVVVALVFFSAYPDFPVAKVHAQNAGNTGTFTSAQTAFTSASASGSSAIFNNIGQSSHFLTFCTTGFIGTIDLEVSFNGLAPWTPIAAASFGQNALSDTGCHILQAGGYFQNVRSTLSNVTAGSISASYSSSSGPIAFAPAAFNSNGATSPVVCDKQGYATFAPSTTSALISSLPGTRIYVCEASFSFTGALTAGIIGIGSNAGACSGMVTQWLTNVTSATPQTFQVGSNVGAFVQLPVGTQLCGTTTTITSSVTIAFSYAQL